MKPDPPLTRSEPVVESQADSSSGAAEAEAALVARAAARDREAFRLLVERYQGRAYGLALRIARNPHDAEEVAQDAFVRAWLALERFRGEARFSTWLYRIVARCAYDRAATLKRRRERETDIDAVAEPATSSGGADSGERARAMFMERLIAELPEAQRAVVTLFYYEDRSVEQVAEVMSLPTGTVKTHLSRARSRLREAWLKQE